MRKHHPKNERRKREYLGFLEEAKRLSPKTTDQVAAFIAQFEASTGYKDFAQFHVEQARRFKRQLAEQLNPDTGKPLAKATVHARLMALKAFFQWLAGQPGYKSRITYSDAEYFNPSANDSRIATASREPPAPSLAQIRLVLETMPDATDIQKRDRALVAFAVLSGARDNALASLSIRHIDRAKRTVFQDARSVRTKNAKTFTTWFFPVGEDVERIVDDWLAHLVDVLHYSPDDPLFPSTHIAVGETGHFEAAGLSRSFWKDAGAIRRIFRQAFEGAGLPYFNPHSFRKTLALLGETLCPNAEALKAWSQNLGHDSVLTTLTSYGTVASHRQAEIFTGLRTRAALGPDAAGPDALTVQQAMAVLQRHLAPPNGLPSGG